MPSSSAAIFSFRRTGEQHGNDNPGDSGDFREDLDFGVISMGCRCERKRNCPNKPFQKWAETPSSPHSLNGRARFKVTCFSWMSGSLLPGCFRTALFRRWRPPEAHLLPGLVRKPSLSHRWPVSYQVPISLRPVWTHKCKIQQQHPLHRHPAISTKSLILTIRELAKICAGFHCPPILSFLFLLL